jgi:hypothetical protein
MAKSDQNESVRARSPRSRRRRNERLIVAGVSGGMLVALLIAGRGVFWATEQERSAAAAGSGAKPQAAQGAQRAAVDETDLGAASNVIDDDGRSMWVSPTAGSPIDLDWLPQGVQMILALRPNALLAHPEGEKLLAALGPLGSEGIRSIEEVCGVRFAHVERLIVGWRIVDGGKLDATLALYGKLAREPSPSPSLQGRGTKEPGDRWQ